MPPATGDRLRQLQQMLERTPADSFLLYGIAMEHKKAGDAATAIDYLNRTIAVDAGYCYAYYQRGQVQEQSGEPDAAKASYREGIAAAIHKGDAHARKELEEALSMLE